MNDVLGGCITGGGCSYSCGRIFLISDTSIGASTATVVARIQVVGMHVLRQVIQTHALPHRVHHESHAEQHDLAGDSAGDRRVIVRLARARHLRFAAQHADREAD